MRTREVIVTDCDNCVLKAVNGSNRGGATICVINKDADVFTCRYGLFPQKCPLLGCDIVIKLRDGVEVVS